MPVVAASLATALAATPALAQGGSAPEAATGAVTTPTEALLNDRFGSDFSDRREALCC